MIKFDLHIHSWLSSYKENKGIVDNSTIENIPILLQKLNEAEVALFSITDHNRFWPELYEKLDEIIASGQYSKVKGLLSGVEFDVQIDPEMSRCHIITIFDSQNRRENYYKIYDAIEKHKLKDRNASYTKQEYEDLLREINLDVILIACQRNSLNRHAGHHNSLSEATMYPEELLMTGYINALEFQKSHVEGILRDNLKKIPVNIGLVTGSDCHEWLSYPNHHSGQINSEFTHSRANILPTFKGLLMAVTSPETRINRQENRNTEYISNICIGESSYPLVNGLIAIIGENGSGKSSLLKILHEKTSESFVKRIQEQNSIQFSSSDAAKAKRLYIEQGQIVKQFEQGNLFPDDNFLEVEYKVFREIYTAFANKILSCIKHKIQARSTLILLREKELEYKEIINNSAYFIDLILDHDFDDVSNPHEAHDKKLKELLEILSLLSSDKYYVSYKLELEHVIDLLNKIYEKVHEASCKMYIERAVKNCIISAQINYEQKVKEAATSRDLDKKDYVTERNVFIKYIVDAIQKNSEEVDFPNIPPKMQGCSENLLNGFSFNSEAVYHDRDVLEDFLKQMFTSRYRTIEALKSIETFDDLQTAIFRCSSIDQIDAVYKKNLEEFLDKMCVSRKYIIDPSQNRETLGNTLGELSLAYFKYIAEHEAEKSIFLIDQPEDHISNNNVSQKLLKYFNSIRTKKQIIMVTHNPLLVVNQDVDQVLFLHKSGDKIEVISGCLEYEDRDVNILDIIANNMDGGKDSIEKRLKVYGKENHTNDAYI